MIRPLLQPLFQALVWLLISAGAGAALAGDHPLAAASADRFLPVDQAYRLEAALLGDRPLLRWQITEGYYLYRHALEFVFHGEDGAAVDWEPDADLPPGQAEEDPYFGPVETYRGQLSLELAPLPSAGTLEIHYQGCAEGGLCYPPEIAYYSVDPARDHIEPTTAPAAGEASVAGGSLLAMAGLAALGGLLLNLMPCVFPVLSLKVLGFVQDRGRSPLRHGLSYSAGVLLSFLLVAGGLIALTRAGRAVGWGFQLQSPIFVGALAYLFLALGLALSGLWAPGARLMGLGQQQTQRRGHSGSLATGVLAVVVASPCTAPFMGTALGYASTQPPLASLAVFLGLGAGMALPVLILCLVPGWLRYLPRPGPWMLRLQQLLAWPLYATAVWLLWVLGRQVGVDAMALLLAGGLLLALALWLWRFGLLARSLAAVALAVALAALTSPLLSPEAAVAGPNREGAETYSAHRLAELRAAGEPVFVNVTADWCLTCLANERVALASEPVRQALARTGTRYLKADWTRRDAAITALLAEHGRNGVPLYLYYAPGADRARVLPQLLTPQRVLEALGDG